MVYYVKLESYGCNFICVCTSVSVSSCLKTYSFWIKMVSIQIKLANH